MKPVISIGNQNFESIRKGNAFYIDKTPFIREWWENQDTVTLITRPRRFGKTLNLNMLDCFFSGNTKDAEICLKGCPSGMMRNREIHLPSSADQPRSPYYV